MNVHIKPGPLRSSSAFIVTTDSTDNDQLSGPNLSDRWLGRSSTN